jgi:hypothetical protein
MKYFTAIVTALLMASILFADCTEQAPPEKNDAPPVSTSIPPEKSNASPVSTSIPAEKNDTPLVSASIPVEILNSNFGFLGATFNAPELEALGIKWDRPHPGPFIWGKVEEVRGIYNWKEVDRYVARAQQKHFAILATIWPFAGWDQADLDVDNDESIVFEREMGRSRHKPNNMEAYQEFVTALVERYDGDGIDDMPGLELPIKYWEASNEPSMQDGFNTFFNGSSEDYLEILKATYQAVKTADTEAKIVQGGMAGMEPWMVSFWEPVLEEGQRYFDIANIHSIGASEVLNVLDFEKLLAKYGIDKPIWVTEAQHRVGMTLYGKELSLEQHAEVMVTSYVLSFAHGVDKIFYTTFRAPPSSDPQFGQSALVGSDGEKRPAYHAVETMISKLDGFTEVEELGTGSYRFRIGDRTVYVLWGGSAVPEGITGQVVVTDIYGQETITDNPGVTDSPAFFELAGY